MENFDCHLKNEPITPQIPHQKRSIKTYLEPMPALAAFRISLANDHKVDVTGIRFA